MCRIYLRVIETLFLLLIIWFCAGRAHASGFALKPASCDFGNVTIPLKSASCSFTVTNNTGAATRVTSFSLSGNQFQLIYGLAPFALMNGKNAFFTIVFAPTQAGPASETLTINFTNQPSVTVPVTGTGVATSAFASPDLSFIDFGVAEQGQTATPQLVTVTNSGGDTVSVTGITVHPPFSSDAVFPAVLDPGGTYTFNVYFDPSTPVDFTDTLVVTYDSLPAEGIDLIGTGATSSTLAITDFPVLPKATKKAAYYSVLNAVAGVELYTWSVANGTSLPAGLTLSSDGIISGAPTGLGSSAFVVQVTDSSVPPLTATSSFSLSVNSPTGSVCNNTSWDITGTTTPIIGLDLLGVNTYMGSMGGLYPNGSNVDDPTHLAFGMNLAQQIQPLDATGNPDPNGLEGFLIIGESNVFLEGQSLVQDAMVSPGRNPSLIVINGGQGGATAGKLVDPNSPYWTTMINYLLPNVGVTAQQVVAAWFEPTNAIRSGTFPTDMNQLYSQIETILQTILVKFPNIKLVYLSSRTYAGYSNGKATDNPEPFAFESGFPVKWTIEDQINGNPALNFDPALGPVLAPWIAWGPYYWADGLVVPSSDGLVWGCQDFKIDGTHPTASGSEKVANEVLRFLKSDPTTAPWFVAP